MAYTYTDKYGIKHATKKESTAKKYASPNTSISAYSGSYGGGYAKDSKGNNIKTRVATPKYTAPTKVATPSTQTKAPWQTQLESYTSSGNRQAADAEIARAGQVYNQKKAAGDIAGADAAHTWANQIRDAIGMNPGTDYNPTTGASIGATTSTSPVAPPPIQTNWWEDFVQPEPLYQQELPYQKQLSDVLGEITGAINKPFNYDPQSDPAYKSSVDAITKSVMESMNQRGLLNSTITSDNTQQNIANIIPQLMNSAYGRSQDNISNLQSLLQGLGGLENQDYNRRLSAEQTAFDRQAQQEMAQLEQAKLEIQAKEADIKNALQMVDKFGYVDNMSAIILGIPVETPSFEARKFAQEQLTQIGIEQAKIDSAMQRAQLSASTSMSNNAASNAASMSNNANTNATALQKVNMQQDDPMIWVEEEARKRALQGLAAIQMNKTTGDAYTFDELLDIYRQDLIATGLNSVNPQ